MATAFKPLDEGKGVLSGIVGQKLLDPAKNFKADFANSQAKVRLRAEAIPSGADGIRYRVTVNGHEAPISFDQLASKLVLAVVKDDPTQLGAAPGSV